MPTAVRKRVTSGDEGKLNSKRRRKSEQEDANVDHPSREVRIEKDENINILTKLNITTSEALVKTLKGGTIKLHDKIAIANAAWIKESIPIPRKAHLLAEWMLDVLNRESKGSRYEAFPSPSLWKMLQETLKDLQRGESLGQLGKYPLIGFILSLGNAIQSHIDENDQMELLQNVIDALKLIPDSHTCTIETLSSAFKVWFTLISKHLCSSNIDQMAAILASLTRTWNEISNQKKSKQILFEKETLECFCKAFKRVGEFSELSNSPIRSYLCRLSFDSFSPSGREKIDYNQVVQLLKSVKDSIHVLPILLKQRCLHLSNVKSLVEQANERKEVWDQLLNPFFELAMKANDTSINTIYSLLSTVEEKRLYPHDVDEAKNALTRLLQHILIDLHRDSTNPKALTCIRLIQHIDEGIFDDKAWQQIFACLANSLASKQGAELLKSICGSFSRLRSLDHFVRLILNGSLKDACDLQKHHSQNALHTILKGTLFDPQCWSTFLGPSFQNFISGEQSVILLEEISNFLSKALSNSNSNEEIVHRSLLLHFSGRIILYMAMSIPARSEIATKLKGMFEDILLPTIESANKKKQVDLSTATIYVIECIISRLDLTSKTDIPANWTELMEEIQSSQKKYLVSPKEISSNPPLQIQMLIAVLERCHRDTSKGVESPFFSWLETFFCSNQLKFSSVAQDVKTISEVTEIGYTALDIIFSAYLPIVEKGGSDKLLLALAKPAEEIMKKHPDCSVAISLQTNATNMELPRWRKLFHLNEKGKRNLELNENDSIISIGKDKLGNGLEEMLRNYESLYNIEGEEAAQILYAPTLVQAIRQITSQEYEEISQKLLAKKTLSSSFPLLVCNGPEGSLAIARSSLNQLLGNYVSSDLSPSETDVQRFEAMAEGKTILFRSREIGCLFVIFTRAIEKDEANVKIFSSIISTLLNFVKLRSEMLNLLLPQMSILMGKLISHFKQSSNLKDSQLIRQARLYTRLCTSLTSRQANLSKPFGLQALPVILSYVRALTFIDGIGIGESRLELERGMFALCGILANWQRDLLFDMMNDDAERIIARKLWRNFESQKYKGE